MNTPFPATSRYCTVETFTLELPAGVTVACLRRRLLPQPQRFALLQYHVVRQDERLDNVTAAYLEDPEQFWRLCDANGAMRPQELMQPVGRKLRITLPEGIPVSRDA
jgi:hypothetical protein